MRSYEPDRDFLRVRDFLNQTYCAFPHPYNWGMERWNYARYFVAPMLGSYGTDTGTPEGSLKAIELWESLVRIWENAEGRIVGVTCIEHPDVTHSDYGEIFVQRHPDHLDLIDEMVAVGEELYINPTRHRTYMWALENDTDLTTVLESRGYVRKDESAAGFLRYTFGEIPEPAFPPGYVLQSMEDEEDIEKRREIFGRGFNHEDPKEWPTSFAYEELMRAPDYQKAHDLYIVAPDGTYAACGIVWHDDVNKVGHLEPLGTHPDHRRKGLAEQIVWEGIRRLKAQGSTWMPMGGGFEPFYRAFGFVETAKQFAWIKTFDSNG